MLVVRAKVLRARLLPVAEVRRGWLASYLLGSYAEGVGATKRVSEMLTTAVVQAWWGPTLHPNNHMRSNAITLGLLCPLHRFAPCIVQCWSVLVALGRLLARFQSLGRDLWRIHDGARRGFVGFARLILCMLNLLSCSWLDWDVICTHEGTLISLPTLAQRNNVGNQARHTLRASFWSWWWQHWDGSRNCLQGVGVGIDRERSLQPLQELKCRRLTFGWDGTDLGARYCRFLAVALWSRHRLVAARKVDDPRCRRCGLDDEHTDHFLWGCPANLEFRNRLNMLCLAAYHLVFVNVGLCLSVAPFQTVRSKLCSVTLLQFCEFGPLTGMPFTLMKLSRRCFKPRSSSVSCCLHGFLLGLVVGCRVRVEPGLCRPCEL